MSNLRIEEHGMPAHIAGLALLDGRALLDEDGTVRLERIRRHVEERIRNVDRLHQVLAWPDGRHRTPTWQNDHDFDITRHVLMRRLPPPGDEETLLRVCCDLNGPPLDRSRPLWELWLLYGLAEGRVALLLRLHHVVADGIASLEMFSSILDAAPGTPLAALGAIGRGGGRRTDPSRSHQSEQTSSLVARIKGTATSVGMRARQGWALAVAGRAPALSWNRPVGSRRVQILVRGDLARAKVAAHQQGGRVNDAVLAVLAGGAYRLLQSRGELMNGLDMHVSVATSIRRPGETGGNRIGVRVVSVPVTDPDTARRLGTIAERTGAQRNRPPLQPNGRLLQRWLVHVMAHQRVVNMVLSNLTGPSTAMWFAGGRVQEMFQLCSLQGNCAVGVGVLSYAGQLNFSVVADPDVVPDAEVFADGVTEALEQLGAGYARACRPHGDRF